MIRALIIDDEPDGRDILQAILAEHFPSVQVVDTAESVATAITAIEKQQPDLVFLDIRLPDGTGFDVLSRLSRINFEVIFVTAHDEYAIRAFQFAAYAYLLKPVRISELRTAIERYTRHHAQIHSTADQRMKILVEHFGRTPKTIRKLILENLDGFEVVQLPEILYVHGSANYSTFHLQDGRKIMVSKTLKNYDGLLEDHGFYRIHKSYLLNLMHVVSYQRRDGGTVEVSNGDQLPVSRRKRQGFLERF